MQIKKHKIAIAIAVALSVVVTGCGMVTHTMEVSNSIDKDNDRIQDLKRENLQFQYTTFDNDIYVGQLTKQDADKPTWWFQKVNYSFRDLPFDVLLQQVFYKTPVSFKYIDSLTRDRAVTVSVNGTLGSALDAIANSAGYSYQVQGDTVVWSKYETKVFDIATYPGLESFGIGKSGQNQTSTNNNSNSSSTTQTTSSVVSSSDEFSHTEGSLDGFKDLKDSIAMMLSADGKLSISPSSTSVVVKDLPTNVAKISEYLDKLNEISNRQVALVMEVIDVQYKDDSQLGIDWKLVSKDLGQLGASVTSDLLAGNASSTYNPTLITLNSTEGRWTGSQALIQALKHQGAVSTKSYPKTVARNNRPAKLRDIKRRYYISKQTATTSINVGTETGIEQGIVETGFSLYVVPKIMNDEVILRLTTNLSALLSLDRKNQTVQGTSGTQSTYVESPNISDKDFDNSITIPNGKTLILAGLTSEVGNADTAYGVGATMGANKSRGETIIAITPMIINP
jgi:Type II secretory pathway, component PulD